MHRWRYILFVTVALGSFADAREPVSALAPFELVANLAGAPTGVAVAPDGAVLVSDAITGTIARVHSSGAVETIALGLDEPQGVALDTNGGLLVVERRGGRVLRLEHDGALTPVAADLRRPEWIAATADGTIFLTAGGREVIAISPDAIHLIADGLDHAAGLAAAPDGLYAVTKHQVLRYSAEGAAAIVPGGLKHGAGVALDALGALWVTAEKIKGSSKDTKGAVGKQGVGGGLEVFARGLRDPRGLAFGPDGSLVVADAGTGEVLRFRAQPAPALAALPAYTSLDRVEISGAADPAARVDAVTDGIVVTAESDARGAFDIVVPLERDTENLIRVFATAHRGAGLTSAPTLASVRQDSQPPSVEFRRPDPALVHRGLVTIEVSARDDASGIDRVALAVDGVSLGDGLGATSVSWDTRAAGDGWHTLSAVAVDRAGNRASASRAVLIDNTPPETRITRGPDGDLLSASAVFAFAGADNLTPADRLRFAWRLDGGAFIQSIGLEVTLDRLAPGDHVFEVGAIDMAGNEDPTPAVARFRVQSGLSVRITEPVGGAMLPAGQALVRGVLEARGQEAGVAVNGVRAAVEGSTFAALVPIFPETTALTAVVTAAGGTGTHAVPITVGDAASLALVALPASGLAPVTVSFRARSTVGLARIELDADGDDLTDVVSADERLSFTYARPGVYTPRIRATDVTGAVTLAQGLVHVLDGISFEAERQRAWNTLRDALSRADVAAALDAFVPDVRERYEVALSVLAAELPRIAGAMRDLSLVSAEAGVAELATTRVEDGITRLYLIYFVQDADGLWRILSM